MKQKLLNTLTGGVLRMLTLLALVITLGASAYATEYTVFNADNLGTWTGGNNGYSCTSGDFKLETVKNNASSNMRDPKNDKHIRLYGNASLTISSENVKMTKIVLTCTTTNYVKTMSVTPDSWTVSNSGTTITATNDGGVNTITLTNTEPGQARISSIVITGEEDTVLGEIKYDGQTANGLILNALKGDVFMFTSANAEEMTLTVGETSIKGTNSVEWTAPSVETTTEFTLNLTAKQGANEETAVVKITIKPADKCGLVEFTPAGGSIERGNFVTLTCENAEEIKYWFGEDESSAVTLPVANADVQINQDCTLNAKGINHDGVEGEVATANYIVIEPTSATFDFSKFDEIQEMAGGVTINKDNVGGLILTNKGVVLKVNNAEGGQDPRIWNYNGADELRIYVSDDITITAPEGKFLSSITFVRGGSKFNLTPNTGVLSSNVWTPTAVSAEDNNVKSVVFTASDRSDISSISVKFNTTTGIAGIEAEAGEAVYYNLQGVRVENPAKGLYIRVANGKSQKVIM